MPIEIFSDRIASYSLHTNFFNGKNYSSLNEVNLIDDSAFITSISTPIFLEFPQVRISDVKFLGLQVWIDRLGAAKENIYLENRITAPLVP